ncbi:MAG: hypothetical protein EBQ59_10955 [Verrucomicrobia bacterium]|nr:hypothetical protein [Verrucomicrobiota bacterium]
MFNPPILSYPMKTLALLFSVIALGAYAADEAKPAAAPAPAAAPVAAPKDVQVEVLDVDGKRFVLVKNIGSAEEFANFEQNVKVISQEKADATQVKQLSELALTTPEREARTRELEGKLARLQADNTAMAKAYGFDLSRQYTVIPTKLLILTALSNDDYIKLAAGKDFKADSVINGGDNKKFLLKDTVTGAVEVESFKLLVQRVLESRKALQQLVDLQPRLTKEEDKKKVEEALKSAQSEVNKALEEFKKARTYDLPNELTIQTAEAKLYTLLSDDEKKSLQAQVDSKKDEAKKDEKPVATPEKK